MKIYLVETVHVPARRAKYQRVSRMIVKASSDEAAKKKAHTHLIETHATDVEVWGAVEFIKATPIDDDVYEFNGRDLSRAAADLMKEGKLHG